MSRRARRPRASIGARPAPARGSLPGTPHTAATTGPTATPASTATQATASTTNKAAAGGGGSVARPASLAGDAGERASWFSSRAAVVGAGAVVMLAIVSLATAGPDGSFFIPVMAGFVADGAVLAGLLLAAWGFGAAVVRRLDSRGAPDVLRVVSAVAVGLGVIALVALALGLAGVLSRPSSVGLLTLGWVCGCIEGLTLLRRQNSEPNAARGSSTGHRLPAWWRAPARGAWLWLAGAPAGALLVLTTAVCPGLFWKPDDPHPYDVLSYHLQIPREWYELGRIVPLTHNAFSYFPSLVETHSLLLMHLLGGPWRAMYAVQLFSGACAVLTALGVYGIVRRAAGGAGGSDGPGRTRDRLSGGARGGLSGAERAGASDGGEHDGGEHDGGERGGGERGGGEPGNSEPGGSKPEGGRLVAAGAALLVFTCPWTLMLGSVAYVEPMMMLFTTLAVGWALQAIVPAGAARGGIAAALPAGGGVGEQVADGGDPSVVDSRGRGDARACTKSGTDGRLPWLGRPGPLLLAGVMCGLGAGVKYTGVPMVAGVVSVVVLIDGLRYGISRRVSTVSGVVRRPAGGTVKAAFVTALARAAVVAVVAAAVFAPWALRNIAWAGNPFFPLATGLLGQAHFSDDQVIRYQRAHGVPDALKPLIPRLGAAVRRTVGGWDGGANAAAGRAANRASGDVKMSDGARSASDDAHSASDDAHSASEGVRAATDPTHSASGRASATGAAQFHIAWQSGAAVLIVTVAMAAGWRRRGVRLVLLVIAGNVGVWFFATHLIPRFLVQCIPLAGVALGLALVGRRGWVATITAVVAGAAALWQTGMVFGVAARYQPLALAGMYRLDDVTALAPPELQQYPDAPLALIGDAQPFLRTTPTGRMEYRTVFDVQVPPNTSAVDGWLGADLATLRRDHVVIVSGDELQRLSTFYYKIPPPDPKWLGDSGGLPIVLPPTGPRK